MNSRQNLGFVAATLVLGMLSPPAQAMSGAEKCVAEKIKAAGNYAYCLQKAESLAVKKGLAPNHARCDAIYSDKWTKTEMSADGMCPTNGDEATMQSFIADHVDTVTAVLAGGSMPTSGFPTTGQTTSYGPTDDGDLEKGMARSLTDNADGTVTDNVTGLVWEKKDDFDGRPVSCASEFGCPNPHDVDNQYTWTAASPSYSGTVVSVFLNQMNNHCSADPTVACAVDSDCSVGPCGFAGYQDWRLPNVTELQSLANYGTAVPATFAAFNVGCTSSCTVTDANSCSCTASDYYWSASTYHGAPSLAWYVSFADGESWGDYKPTNYYARAVRGGK